MSLWHLGPILGLLFLASSVQGRKAYASCIGQTDLSPIPVADLSEVVISDNVANVRFNWLNEDPTYYQVPDQVGEVDVGHFDSPVEITVTCFGTALIFYLTSDANPNYDIYTGLDGWQCSNDGNTFQEPLNTPEITNTLPASVSGMPPGAQWLSIHQDSLIICKYTEPARTTTETTTVSTTITTTIGTTVTTNTPTTTPTKPFLPPESPCPPEAPEKPGSNGPPTFGGGLHCWTCDHAHSLEECFIAGQYEACDQGAPGQHAYCYQRSKNFNDGTAIWYMGCKYDCDPKSLVTNPHGEICTYGGDEYIHDCYSCGFGPEEPEEGIPKWYRCGKSPVRSCFCRGDPHCKTFDGLSVSLPGGCEYILSTNAFTSLPLSQKWSVSVNPDEDIPGINPVFTIASLSFLNFGSRFILGRNYLFLSDLVAGSQTLTDADLPFTSRFGVTASKEGNIVKVHFPGHVTLYWDNEKDVRVEIEDDGNTYAVAGICGNMDGDSSNDMITGFNFACTESLPNASPFTPTTNVQLFMQTWMIAQDNDDPSCTKFCPQDAY